MSEWNIEKEKSVALLAGPEGAKVFIYVVNSCLAIVDQPQVRQGTCVLLWTTLTLMHL
jgi:hypothetical protein